MAGHRLAPKVAAAISRRETAESGASGRSVQSSSTWSRWAVPLGSAGLAASIAVIGVLGMFWLGGGANNPVADETAAANTVKEIVIPAAPQDRTIVVASASPLGSSASVAYATRDKPAASSNVEPESYVTPPIREGGVASAAPAFELASYVGAHSAVSAPMMRHSAISAVIATPQQAVAVAPMSEAPR
jgi:hypothetical protein